MQNSGKIILFEGELKGGKGHHYDHLVENSFFYKNRGKILWVVNKKFKKIKLLKDYKKIMIEQFIPGREIQAAIIGKKKLGAIELKPKRKFYDYEAKYNSKAKTKHIIPVELVKKILIHLWT